MLRHVRWVHDRHGRLVVAPRGAFGALGDGHAVRPGALEVHTWLNDPTQRPVIVDLLRKSLGVRVDLQRTDLREYAALLTRAFESGDLRARKMKLPHLHRDRVDEAPPPVKTEETKQKHVLDFVVEYPDGTPVKGPEWELRHPGGKKETGKLGEDGAVHRDGVPDGTYELHLKEVEHATWRDKTHQPGAQARLVARVWGFANGTSAKVRLFRELEETDDDVLKTLQGKVEENMVELDVEVDAAGWTKGRKGLVGIVAEVSLDGGKHWAKTQAALEVAGPSIAKIHWLRGVIGGRTGFTDTGLRIVTTGLADGTKVRAEISRIDPERGEEALGTVEGQLARGEAILSLSLDEDLEGKAAPLEGTTLRRWGQYRALVAVAGDPELEGRSPRLSITTTDPALVGDPAPGGG